MTERGPLHPVSRIGRVLQQMRSFTTLHAAELEGVATELDAAGQGELAARLRIFRDLHAQEAGLIVDELTDVQSALDREPDDGATSNARTGARDDGVASADTPTAGQSSGPLRVDPAAGSPKRGRWLAEQARQAEEARRPRSRRDLFRRGADE